MWWTLIVAIKIGILLLHRSIKFLGHARKRSSKPTSTLIRFLIESLARHRISAMAGGRWGRKAGRLNAAADSWPPIRKCLVAHQLLQTANGLLPSPFLCSFPSAQTLLSVCSPWIVVLSPLIPVEGGTEGELQLISPLCRFRIEDVALLILGKHFTWIQRYLFGWRGAGDVERKMWLSFSRQLSRDGNKIQTQFDVFLLKPINYTTSPHTPVKYVRGWFRGTSSQPSWIYKFLFLILSIKTLKRTIILHSFIHY